LGQDAYIRVHDTLEGELVWLKLLSESGFFYSLSNENKLLNLMHGLPRNVLPSGFSFVPNMINYLGMYSGYIMAQYLLKTSGYTAFYLLIRRYMHLPNLAEWVKVSIPLMITSIQFFTPFGLSIVGMPLVAFAFSRLYYKKGIITTLIILFFFPFFSSLVWSGIELIILFSFAIIIIAFYDRDQIKHWILALLAFISGSVLANIQFLNGMLFLEGFRSHRVLYNTVTDMPNFWHSLNEFLMFFFSVHYHVSIFVSLLILVVFMVAYHGIEANKWARNIMLGITAIVLWQAFYTFIEYLLRDIIFIKSFHFNRFGFVLPFLWLVLLIISLDIIAKVPRLKRWIPLILVSQFFIFMLTNDETVHNYKKLIGKDNFPSYREYLAQNLFQQIKHDVPILPQDKTLSIGLSPSIAQFNGLLTLDGLFSVYDLNYKLEFRKIFEKELEKVTWERREYFDNWGNRCYVFPAEIPLETVSHFLAKHDKLKLKNLEIDIKQFVKMGGKYILSACELLNYQELGIKPRGKYGDINKDFWIIYVYEAQ
jgi:hypothetical protein